MNRHIPLLSGRKFSEFSPSEFKAHVHGLFYKPVPKKKAPAKKKPLLPIVWRINKQGTLVLKINRKPKHITPEEITQLAKDSGIEERLIWIKVGAKKSGIEVRRT
jgi:hypothetical protein